MERDTGQSPATPSAWGQSLTTGATPSAWGQPLTTGATPSLRDVMAEQSEQEQSQKKPGFQTKRSRVIGTGQTPANRGIHVFRDDIKAQTTNKSGSSGCLTSSEFRSSKTAPYVITPQKTNVSDSYTEPASSKSTSPSRLTSDATSCTPTKTTVVNIRQNNLKRYGYKNLEDWVSRPNHVYIGRNMTFYVPGAVGSKWRNPFSVNKYGREECVNKYKEYIMSDMKCQENGKTLSESLDELRGKELGCWCHPELCHGHVLVELLEKGQQSGD